MGRPRVRDQDKRIVQVNIRLTEEEHKKTNSIRPGKWIKSCKLDAKESIHRKIPASQAVASGHPCINELRSIGVNLNQIARKVNQGEGHEPHFDFLMDI